MEVVAVDHKGEFSIKSTASWVKKNFKMWGGGAGSCSFPTDRCKFPTDDMMGVQHFSFAPKFPGNGGFSVLNFVLLEENFLTG